MNISNSSRDSATCIVSRHPARAAADAASSNPGIVEYGAWGDSPAPPRPPPACHADTHAMASFTMSGGSRRLRTPVNSRNECTRRGVPALRPATRCGNVSMFATVVVPVATNCRAPSRHDAANSSSVHADFAARIDLIQSAKDRVGAMHPTRPV